MGKLTNLNPDDPQITTSRTGPWGTRSWGTHSILGSGGSSAGYYAGFHFPAAANAPHFMFNTGRTLHGVWTGYTTNHWNWFYDQGKFFVFNGLAIEPQNQRGTFVGFDKSTGSFPGSPALDLPVVKTDAAVLYFSVNGQASASISANGTYVAVSDKNRKQNAEEVNYSSILQKLLEIPIYNYTFKDESDRVKRCGCYAQDFYQKFKLGGDEEIDADESPMAPSRTIASSDAIGVLMGALKGLAAEVAELKLQLSATPKK